VIPVTTGSSSPAGTERSSGSSAPGPRGTPTDPPSGAAFYLPEGLAFDEEAGVLYVADAGNHTIRQVSWPDLRVETVAGTGLEAPSPGEGGPGTGVALNAPRDLALMGDYLYIAMAGANQVWRMDLATHTLEPYAGSGLEGLMDGPLHEAAFASPSGIVTDGEALYIADSGASAIRRIQRGDGRDPHRPLPGRLRRPRHHRKDGAYPPPDGYSQLSGGCSTSPIPTTTRSRSLTRTPAGSLPGSGAGIAVTRTG